LISWFMKYLGHEHCTPHARGIVYKNDLVTHPWSVERLYGCRTFPRKDTPPLP
jgi:hypothetical protein